MKRVFSSITILTFSIIPLFLVNCSDNPAGVLSETEISDGSDPDNSFQGRGFGVSGLLFENNLVMWFRENEGQRSELFPQMYGIRVDAGNFPVWGRFPQDLMVPGGVRQDGIPALVNPPFVSPSSSDLSYLREEDLVIGVAINGEAKAYPENILWWHEIANDLVGGVPIIASFCPLTGTAIIFKMPDDPNTVDELEMLPVIETTWAKWRELYPEATAISSNTGFNRDYTRYPYGSYRQANTQPLFPLRTREFLDSRFPPKHTVLGLVIDGNPIAYPFALEGNQVINDSFNGREILVVSEVEARLAIPYDRQLDGQLLTFERTSSPQFEMRDKETGSIWNILGVSTSGQLQGRQLTQLPAYNAFWFAWSTFWPATSVFDL